MLSNAGDQLPSIPFKEVVGNSDIDSPEQIESTASNEGTISGLTVIVTLFS